MGKVNLKMLEYYIDNGLYRWNVVGTRIIAKI